MDWRAEAEALIRDISGHVSGIKVCPNQEFSRDTRVYFQIETLEQQRLLVSLDTRGFTICDIRTADGAHDDSSKCKTYETINALLDDTSPMYRESFARALADKIKYVLA